MAIVMRRGLYGDFDKGKLLPGEWAVVLENDPGASDGKTVYICFSAGVVKRMGTYEDFKGMVTEATVDVRDEYIAVFDEIEKRINAVAEQVDSDKQTIIVIRDTIINTYIPRIEEYAAAAEQSKENAATSEKNASASEANARNSATAAATSQTAAKTSENNANTYKSQAESSATTASTAATSAQASETNASKSAAAAKASETNAQSYQATASAAANTASTQATAASKSSEAAKQSETASKNWSDWSKSYAVGEGGKRDGEESDNSKYYYEQAKRISQGLEGALLPMGTINFVDLKNQTKNAGYMYNIKDAFTSDDTFEDGGSHYYGAGSNVYCTASEMLNARINQYGVEKILFAIEKIRESDFLQGKNRDGWAITFDWFVKPNNFPKVLDGNYDNRSGTKNYQSQTKQMLDSSYEMMGDWARKRMEGDVGDDP